MSTERAPINVLLRSEQSEEHIAVMDNTVGAGFPGPPLHHHDFDETFYVLEGELTFQLEDEVFTRKAGELAFAPRNVPHTFANLSGAERAGVEPPASALEPYPETIVVGPRIGEQDPEAQQSNRKERSS